MILINNLPPPATTMVNSQARAGSVAHRKHPNLLILRNPLFCKNINLIDISKVVNKLTTLLANNKFIKGIPILKFRTKDTKNLYKYICLS